MLNHARPPQHREPKRCGGGFQLDAKKATPIPNIDDADSGAGDSGPPRCNRRRTKRRTNYKLGSLYAVVTALLLSVQEPFSFLAAKRLSVTQFVFLTQVALLMSIPLLIARGKSRRDLVLSARERR